MGDTRIKRYIGLNMSQLIIHPQDPSTDFLKAIYALIPNITVITDGIDKNELQKLVRNHERIIMLGHGTSLGLLSVGQFLNTDSYIIDSSIVELISQKKDNIFIWCDADLFVQRHGLHGFYTGMFVSEVSETYYCGLYGTDWNLIEESNQLFASTVSKHINEPSSILYKNVVCDYSMLAKTNPIAQYNLERLFFAEMKRD